MKINRDLALMGLIGLAILTILSVSLFIGALSLWREARSVQALQVEPLPRMMHTPVAPTPQIIGPALVDRKWFVNQRGEWWPVSDVPPTPAPTVPALGGPLRKLPDGTWAYRPQSGATWADLTQAERDILRMPALCPSSWYNDYATAGTLCPEAIEFMANYDKYRADFEADYYRRYGR